MLRRLALVLLVVVAVMMPLGMMTPSATADDPPVVCTVDPETGRCVVTVDPNPGPNPGAGEPGEGQPVGGKPSECRFDDDVVPCQVDEGYWSNDRLCYVARDPNPPPGSDPIWEGNYPEGAIYTCWLPASSGTTQFWSATSPAGPAAPPDPRVLAQQAVSAMNLRAITIGIVPETRPGSVGVIGMPTWMWAQNPGATSLGPVTRSASAGGYTVSATARAQRTVWSMGDGSTVTCRGPGTPYADKYGKRSSPTCGHTYTRQGRYTVRATTHWVVSWSGIGQTGTIPLSFTDSTTITMGEVQVLN